MKDLEFFMEIWSERDHYSEISGEPLYEFSPVYFSHLVTKGSRPDLRHNKDNIVLMTFDEHREWEFGDRDKLRKDKKWNKVFKQFEKLKSHG